LGYKESNWTGRLLIRRIKKHYGVDYKQANIYILLKELGISYQRPTRLYGECKEEVQESFKKKLKKKLEESIDTVFLAQDECSLLSLPTKHQKWAQKGRQPKVVTYTSKRKRKKHHGGYKSPEWDTKAVFLLIPVTARHFWYFSNPFLEEYPKQNICMILDNVRFHHAKVVQEFLEENPRLEFLFFLHILRISILRNGYSSGSEKKSPITMVSLPFDSLFKSVLSILYIITTTEPPLFNHC
jgi:hypothetical protein